MPCPSVRYTVLFLNARYSQNLLQEEVFVNKFKSEKLFVSSFTESIVILLLSVYIFSEYNTYQIFQQFSLYICTDYINL